MRLATINGGPLEDRNLRPPVKPLNALEVEIIDLFVQFSHILGHPCKIYNILSVAAPVLYIGPRPSHLSEILDRISSDYPCAWAAHGEVDRVVEQIQRLRQQSAMTTRPAQPRLYAPFSKEALLPKLITELESG